MLDSDFVHLHVHGQHSLLDGLTKPDQAMQAAVADGQHAQAVTDHGSLGGMLKSAKAAAKHGIKLIPGAELYLSIGDRHEQNHVMIPREDDFDGSGGDEGSDRGAKRKIYEHLTVLATNKVGWRNLQLIDNASHDTFYGKPRADYTLLAEHASGLVAGTGCLGGPVAGQLLIGDEKQAQQNLARLVEIFGHDQVFVEVMDHGIAAEQKVIPGLVRLAKQFDLPIVATNDAHYAGACDAKAHDAWLAISASKGNKKVLVSDDNRFRFNGSGYHLRTSAEMHALFDNQPGTEMAVVNSLLIADMVEDNIVLGSIPDHHLLPTFPVPDGYADVDAYFHEQVRQGLIQRYGAPLPAVVRERARHEETVIREFGVVSYFMVIADMIAREREAGGLVGAGRGSGAGSICAYALGITNIDPIENGLLFERFLNPTRKGLPDFDTDFQASRQMEAFRRAASVYGDDKVARIGTYGNAWAKDALKKMGRVLAKDEVAGKLAAAIPGGDAKKWTLATLLDEDNPTGAELRTKIAELGDEAQELVDMALAVEGSAAADTIHACGIIISPDPLPGSIPLRRDRKNGNFPVTQWDATDSEAAQYVKFDFLAIKDLDVVAKALELIADSTGETVDIMNLRPDADDDRAKATRAMLAAGRTAGVFQLASKGMTELVMKIQPEDLHDLSIALALYRPGPMGANMHEQYAQRRRFGAPVDYSVYSPVPAEQEVVATVLDRTKAAIVFQEQLMQLAQVVADFAPGQMADLQKAFSKKKAELMDPLFPIWVEGGMRATRADGTPKVAFRKSTLEGMWRTFEASSSYLFNASHSYAYAMLTWQTAYLKANWPAHYGAALLECTTKAEKRQQVLVDLVADGIEVRPPSVNESAASTSASADGAILFGLAEIKDVGDAGRTIITEREINGRYTSVADLVERTKITSTAIQALAEAGALDEFGPRLGITMAARVYRVPGVSTPDMEWGVMERSARQRARLGVPVGEHPMAVLHSRIKDWKSKYQADTAYFQVHNLPEQDVPALNVLGVVASVEEKFGRGGKRLVMQLESAKAHVEVVMWANRYAAWRSEGNPLPYAGQIVAVAGRLRATTVVPQPADADDDADGQAVETVDGEVVERPAETILNLFAERIDKVELDDPVRSLAVAGSTSTPTLIIAPAPDQLPRMQRVAAAEPSLPLPAAEPARPSAGGEPVAVNTSSRLVHEFSIGAAANGRIGLAIVVGTMWKKLQRLFNNVAEAEEWWEEAALGDEFTLKSSEVPWFELVLVAATSSDGALFEEAGKAMLETAYASLPVDEVAVKRGRFQERRQSTSYTTQVG